MLLGSDRIPRYMPDSAMSVDRSELILGLSLLSLVFYILQIYTTKVSMAVADSCVKKLIHRTEKIALFEDQEEFATNTFKKYAESLTNILFSTIAFIAVLIIYQEIFLIIVALSAVYLVSHKFYKNNESNSLSAEENEGNNDIYGIVSSLAFLCVFGFIVVDFLYLTPPSFIHALSVLILCRQLKIKLGSAIRLTRSLTAQREKISALFFKGETLADPRKNISTNNGIWGLLEQDSLTELINEILSTIGDPELTTKNTTPKWLEAGISGVIFLELFSTTSERKILVKIFDSKTSTQAIHEATLLLSKPAGLPAPELLRTTMISNYHCHIMEITGYNTIKKRSHRKVQQRFKQLCLQIPPPPELEERYIRSKEPLGKRFQKQSFSRLYLIGTNSQIELLNNFMSHKPLIEKAIKNTPLRLVQKTTAGTLLEDKNNDIILIHWGRWSMEPAGFEFRRYSTKFSESTSNGNGVTTDSLDISSTNQQLTSAISALEDLYQNQKYLQAFKLIDFINKNILQTLSNNNLLPER